MADQKSMFGDSAPEVPKPRSSKQRAKDARVERQRVVDSFQNFGLNLGLGTDNALTGSTYGFNPITRIRTLLEWIYRGSWIGGVAVDLVADDMTRAGVDLQAANMKPEAIEEIQKTATALGIWNAINDCEKWARLYGGAIAVMLIDGQDMATPLDVTTIRPGQFKGLAVFDRWSCTPSSNLVQSFGPMMGLPMSYTIGIDAPGLRGAVIHHTRCLRLVGIELPWNQRVAENMWGLSIIERLYDRMVAFDSATQGAAQLVYRIANRTYKLDGMRQLVAAGADYIQILARYMDATRKFAGIEGITVIDGKDELVTEQLTVQAGISDALVQFGQQLSGATQIPLVRLFGQSPAGLNSTGESDLRTYYDNIANQQKKELLEPVLTIFRAIAYSCGHKPDEKFTVAFNPLWQLKDTEKAEIAERDARTVGDLVSTNMLDKAAGLRELRESGRVTGRFKNITDEMIADAEKEAELMPPPGSAEALLGGNNPPPDQIEGEAQLLLEDKRDKAERRTKTGDAHPFKEWRGLQIMIETPKGGWRKGAGWMVQMPADYGFIRGTSSAEGVFEQMDCFVGDGSNIFVIDSATPEGKFDEHKVMLGFDDALSAEACYRAAYHDARRPMSVTEMTIDSLREWIIAGRLDSPIGDVRPPLRAVR